MSFSIFPPCVLNFFNFTVQPLSIRNNIVVPNPHRNEALLQSNTYSTNHRIASESRNDREATYSANCERVPRFISDRKGLHFRRIEPLDLKQKRLPTQKQVERVVRSHTSFRFKTQLIGRGAFGIVYRMTWNRDRDPVTVFKVGLNSKKSCAKFENENAAYDWIAQCGNHKHIIRKIKFFIIDSCPFLELSSTPSACDLDKYFILTSPNPSNIQKLVNDILEALRFLHERCHMAHVDIKNDNILFCKGNYVLCDLGSAQQLSDSICDMGNTYFRHPEVQYTGKAGQRKNDLWALGVVIFSTVTRENFFTLPEENISEFNKATVSSKNCQKILFRLVRKTLPKEQQQKLDLVTKKYFPEKVFDELLQKAKNDQPNLWYKKGKIVEFLESESKNFQLTKESPPFTLKGEDLFPTMKRLLSIDAKEKSSELLEKMKNSLTR